ncbi:hypothetical protein [Streptomyces sp. H39-S7]|uniref:hypothetical protein n=1 Tax=Streptomyces sp. H39-S7 TaxID=3004357 RepID=UPI0022AE59C5|nr:hypothetical protein [Streptomyces sp. H39-S7]MCZ4123606.1 hypothetical protein [Streptomyces sp. H39-S7]
MSKHQKGRRHRTVNRNPRPVGIARPPAAPRTPAASGPATGRTVVADEQSGTRAPETSQPAARQQPATPEKPVAPDAPRSSEAVPDGGLGHHAVRTWQEVQSAGDDGITVDELCTAVGYQSRTILKHLKVLAQDGLAEPHGERWRSTGQKLF